MRRRGWDDNIAVEIERRHFFLLSELPASGGNASSCNGWDEEDGVEGVMCGEIDREWLRNYSTH